MGALWSRFCCQHVLSLPYLPHLVQFIRGAEYVGDVFARRVAETSSKQRRLLCSLLIKAADVSNPMRPFSAALDSATRCLAEFTAQGDREADLHVAVPPGRNRALIRPAKSQLDFIGFIVKVGNWRLMQTPLLLLPLCSPPSPMCAAVVSHSRPQLSGLSAHLPLPQSKRAQLHGARRPLRGGPP